MNPKTKQVFAIDAETQEMTELVVIGASPDGENKPAGTSTNLGSIKKPNICNNCHKKDHISSECTKKYGKKKNACSICHIPGHKSPACPDKQKNDESMDTKAQDMESENTDAEDPGPAALHKLYEYECPGCAYSFKSKIPPNYAKCPDCRMRPKVLNPDN